MQHLAPSTFFKQQSGDDAWLRLFSIGLLFVNLVTENNNEQQKHAIAIRGLAYAFTHA